MASQSRMEQDRREVSNMLVFYFKTVWEKAGLKWEFDNESEVRGIVNVIFDSIKEK